MPSNSNRWSGSSLFQEDFEEDSDGDVVMGSSDQSGRNRVKVSNHNDAAPEVTDNNENESESREEAHTQATHAPSLIPGEEQGSEAATNSNLNIRFSTAVQAEFDNAAVPTLLPQRERTQSEIEAEEHEELAVLNRRLRWGQFARRRVMRRMIAYGEEYRNHMDEYMAGDDEDWNNEDYGEVRLDDEDEVGHEGHGGEEDGGNEGEEYVEDEEDEAAHQRAQEEIEREEAEFEALPRHEIILNSPDNSLLSTIKDYKILNPPEICSICQSGLHEGEYDGRPSEESVRHTDDEECYSNRLSILNCSCRSKFHFKCINYWLAHPYSDETLFLAASCPNCRARFRIVWTDGYGVPLRGGEVDSEEESIDVDDSDSDEDGPSYLEEVESIVYENETFDSEGWASPTSSEIRAAEEEAINYEGWGAPSPTSSEMRAAELQADGEQATDFADEEESWDIPEEGKWKVPDDSSSDEEQRVDGFYPDEPSDEEQDSFGEIDYSDEPAEDGLVDEEQVDGEQAGEEYDPFGGEEGILEEEAICSGYDEE